ncbi:hypothetical protein EMCRGX_G022933 [Ephydatia muelleri]
MYELFYNTIGNTIYTGLLELKKGEVFNKDECDTYVYKCIGGNHSRLAHQQILEENPDLNTDRHFSHRSVSIYVNLTEEQAQHLAHRHNRTTEFINVMTTQDKVHLCQMRLFTLNGLTQEEDETPNKSQQWRDSCAETLMTTDLLKKSLPSWNHNSLYRARCSFQGGSTPLCPDAWARLLHAHPDSAFSTYLINGLINGFRIGFNRRQPLGAVTKNMPSALKQQTIVAAYIDNEITLGRLIGPLPTNVAQFIHRNRNGVVPKGHTPGKWRLITDLSFPPGYSVNNGIDPVLCSLSYVSIDSVTMIVASLGAGSLLAMNDIESAYRLVPVHPDDRSLLGVEWSGWIYCDAMLPFGLRSSAKIFTALADALEWIVRQRGVSHIAHYLDDFIVAKCDQFGERTDVFIGKTGNTICPVDACLAYVAVRGASPGPSGSAI